MGLLALLGFSVTEGCRVEYGCPIANYTITGEVTSEDNVKLSGIRVTVSLDGDWEQDHQYGFVTTDAEGRYQLDMYSYIWSDQTAVKFEDVDGPANGGAFKTKIVTVDPEDRKQVGKGDGKWYEGDWLWEVNVVLEKEEN